MAETFVNRARVIMARLKDNSSPLDGKIGVTEGTRYVNAFVIKYAPQLLKDADGNPVDIGDVPVEDKGKAYVNALRRFHREVYVATQNDSAVASASSSAKSTANSTVDTELGTDE